MKKLNETQIQAQAYQTLYNKYPLLRLCLFSVPNEALFSVADMLPPDKRIAIIGKFKATGLTKGVNDMIFYWQGVTYWLELKDDEGRVSKDQILFHRNLKLHNFDTSIYRTVDEVINKVEQIMKTFPLTPEQIAEKEEILREMIKNKH